MPRYIASLLALIFCLFAGLPAMAKIPNAALAACKNEELTRYNLTEKEAMRIHVGWNGFAPGDTFWGRCEKKLEAAERAALTTPQPSIRAPVATLVPVQPTAPATPVVVSEVKPLASPWYTPLQDFILKSNRWLAKQGASALAYGQAMRSVPKIEFTSQTLQSDIRFGQERTILTSIENGGRDAWRWTTDVWWHTVLAGAGALVLFFSIPRFAPAPFKAVLGFYDRHSEGFESGKIPAFVRFVAYPPLYVIMLWLTPISYFADDFFEEHYRPYFFPETEDAEKAPEVRPTATTQWDQGQHVDARHQPPPFDPPPIPEHIARERPTIANSVH